MALALTGDDLARKSTGSRSWASASFREAWHPAPEAFGGSTEHEEDEEQLKWAAIERLPTYDRLRKAVLRQVLDDGRVVGHELDLVRLGSDKKRMLVNNILRVVEEDYEKFLQRLRSRVDRVGIQVPTIEVRYEHLSVEGEVHVGSRAIPTLLNAILNVIEVNHHATYLLKLEGISSFHTALRSIRLAPSNKRKITILKGISGIVKPSRMTLLLGPPGAGKTTLLQALAGKIEDNLKVQWSLTSILTQTCGKITYCGHEMDEFVPQRTCAYVSQHDLHHGEMTVRETLNFSRRCLGTGRRYEMLAELSRREKEAGINPDPEIDAFMKAVAVAGQKSNLATDCVLKLLGLDICSDIMVGDQLKRGISGGQKKRVTTGEMLVGPATAIYMDEISTGLDSSTTFQIVNHMKHMVHVMDITMIISLLQPAPETYNLFDDIILLSEGQIVYQGPREHVTSKKDQVQYWIRKDQPYRYISVPELAEAFKAFHVGQRLAEELSVPYDKSKTHPAALVTNKYGLSNWEILTACFSREWLLMKRNSFVYIFKTVQITIMAIVSSTVFLRTQMPHGQLQDGGKYFGALFFSLINIMFNGMAELSMTVFRLPIFFKQRDSLFYPAWAFSLPVFLLRVPLSFMESAIWIILTYYTIGLAPSPARFFQQYLTFFCIHTMALSLFRFIAAIGRTQVVANTLGTFTLLVVFVCGGFVVAKGDVFVLLPEDALKPWIRWAAYISPMSYGQNAIVMSEFLDKRWSAPNLDPRIDAPTVGKALLKGRGFYTEWSWYWICIAALLGFSVLFNGFFVVALTFLNPLGDSRTVVLDENQEKNSSSASNKETSEGLQLATKKLSFSFKAHRIKASFIVHHICMTCFLAPTMFVEEVMELVELKPIRNLLAGLPGVDGLSTEQRKRLTIAVELVANPSIIFMDEPTSGLDARAAAIVMRTVRNTVDTGRTVVCTIHQPSIDIFESFDELLLMKRGGRVIYAGPLGRNSQKLIDYFEASVVPGVPKITPGYNPATWMLEISTPSVEAQLQVDFADIFAESALYKRNEELIAELSTAPPGSKDLYFPTKYSQPIFTQIRACFWKQRLSYWRNPRYNAIRFMLTVACGVIFGVIFWDKGGKMQVQQDLLNLMGAIYSCVLFLGATNASSVQGVVSIERTVFYRERGAGMYSAFPYAIGQVAIEVLYVSIQTFVYTLIIYSMIGFEWTAAKFFLFYYFLLTCYTYYTMFGMMLVALTPNIQVAAISMSFFMSFWNLFSGFLIPRTQIPIWWRWYYWGSPVAWSIYGTITCQIGDKTNQVVVPGSPNVTVKGYLKHGLGYDHDFLPVVGVVHICWVLLFAFGFALGIRYLNFQTR
ncbi:unnamed protein product [Coffea canephora]|uniref:ABC transporter domain-containing protein n=1 Tax=Coffea canephora TaxID=49390 RepID=A0A068V3Y6_COFCA|nr:unnamed protein product [Coffea canephora]